MLLQSILWGVENSFFRLLSVRLFGHFLGYSKDRNHIIGCYRYCTWFFPFSTKVSPTLFPEVKFCFQKLTHRQITHKNGLGTSNEKEERVKKGKKRARSKSANAKVLVFVRDAGETQAAFFCQRTNNSSSTCDIGPSPFQIW